MYLPFNTGVHLSVYIFQMRCAILFTRESQNIKGGLTVTPGRKKGGDGNVHYA